MQTRTYRIDDKLKSFNALGLKDIKPGAVAPLCLDDQWIERDGYRAKRQPLQNHSHAAALRELKKGLIFAPQIVVNRAFVLNTPIITGLLDSKSPDRKSLLELLTDQSLALYVLNNADPLFGAEKALEKSSKGERAWLEACREVSPACVRFSWDEKQEAIDRADKLVGMFRRRVEKLAAADPTAIGLAVDPTADLAKLEGLRGVFSKLEEVVKSEEVNRTSLYKQFVWENEPQLDDSGKPIRKIDYGKPCVAEIKQLLDLIYNTNLTDSLQIASLTPAGSLDRSILSEDAAPGEFIPMSGEHAAAFVHRLYTETRLEGIKPFPFEEMSLEHIAKLRKSDSWRDYHNAKLHLSEIAGFADFNNFEVDCIERAAVANAKFKALCEEAFKEFGRYYAEVDGPVQNGVRAGFHIGGVALGAVVEGLMGGASVIGALMAERITALIGKKFGQTIETKIAMGVGTGMHAFYVPRIGWADNEIEARKFVAELRKMDFGKDRAETQLELFPAPSTIGYELKSDAPDYG